MNLHEDVSAAGADGFADANFLGALGDADEHDVHHANAADEQADGGDDEGEGDDGAGEILPEVGDQIGRSDLEVVGLCGGDVAAAAGDFGGLVLAGAQPRRGGGADGCVDRIEA